MTQLTRGVTLRIVVAQSSWTLDSSILDIEICSEVVTPNDLSEVSWQQTRRRKSERRAIAEALAPYGPSPGPGDYSVRFTRSGPKPLDDDNLAYAFKTYRDQVADWLQMDDNDPRLRWAYGQGHGESGRFRLSIARAFHEWPRPLAELLIDEEDPRRDSFKPIKWETTPGVDLARVSSTPARAKHSELVISSRTHPRTGPYMLVCVHYTNRIRWRSPGVAVFGRQELEALRDACTHMLETLPPVDFEVAGGGVGVGSAQEPPPAPTVTPQESPPPPPLSISEAGPGRVSGTLPEAEKTLETNPVLAPKRVGI